MGARNLQSLLRRSFSPSSPCSSRVGEKGRGLHKWLYGPSCWLVKQWQCPLACPDLTVEETAHSPLFPLLWYSSDWVRKTVIASLLQGLVYILQLICNHTESVPPPAAPSPLLLLPESCVLGWTESFAWRKGVCWPIAENFPWSKHTGPGPKPSLPAPEPWAAPED